jgi:pyruvate dehydrogenase E2 component (dihydrolipoamide acetyltransferase)
MSDFLMPSLGADMDTGTLLEWYVKPGDPVKRGDIVALVDTSKAEIEIEIFEDGVIGELHVQEGARVPVGTVLATVLSAAGNGAPPPQAVAVAPPEPAVAVAPPEPAVPEIKVQRAAPPPPPPSPPPEPSPPPPPEPSPVHEEHRLRVSPVARRAAVALGVDLQTVSGTGPSGAIRLADVEALTGTRTRPSPKPEAADRQLAMREAIAALMARSKREIPHYYLELQVDMTRALDWLHETNLRREVTERLLPSALLLSAVAHAAAEMPEMNGFWLDGAFKPGSGVHIGVAISLRGGGLIAPALHDADKMTLDELMAGTRDLVARARSGRLRSSEMSDPTITVTNLGERGVDLVHGVIYAPQVALVGFGGVHERPWADQGMLGVRPVVVATLAADHRAGDGHTGSRFLTLIEHRLQRPEEL